MRITRLYHPHPLDCGHTVSLENDASNHLVKVLRTPVNTTVVLFNGDGYDYLCTTLDTDRKHTTLSIDSRRENPCESPLATTLVQGLSKHDRMETTIQKCVELGINRIIPTLFQRSNVRLDKDKRSKKLEHWKRVAVGACEQSGRSHIPEITEILEPGDIAPLLEGIDTRLVLDPEADTALHDIGDADGSVCYIISPEGGVNDDEFGLLDSMDFTRIRFGSRVLRTETAGPAVLSALQVMWGDCG